jgi:hypothetical protein
LVAQESDDVLNIGVHGVLSENETCEFQGAAAAHAQSVQSLFDKAAAGVAVAQVPGKVK